MESWKNREEEKNYVNYKLSFHPMPRNQGPIMHVIDNDDDGENIEEHGTKLIEKVAWRGGGHRFLKTVDSTTFLGLGLQIYNKFRK